MERENVKVQVEVEDEVHVEVTGLRRYAVYVMRYSALLFALSISAC